MLGKSSIFMMLLLVVASLVGISSIYTPANVETQPIQQPQQPQQQKPQNQLGGGLIMPQDKIQAGQNTPQAIQRAEDRKLLDRR